MATSYQDQCPHRKDVRRIAFTLIEVLVVVAIIALLLSILLPSLARSRDQARRTLCASQLHQLSVAMYAYASDFKGKGPIRGWFSYTIAETNHEAYGTVPRDSRARCNLGLLYGRYAGKSWELMSCPTYYPILRDMKSIVDAPGLSKGGLLSTEDQRLTWSYGGYDYAFPIAPRGNWPMLDSKSVYPTGHIREDYAKLLKRKRGLPDNAPEPVITGIQALISDWAIGGPSDWGTQGSKVAHGNGLQVLYSDGHARFIQTDKTGTSGSSSTSAVDMWYYFNTHP